MQKIAEFYSNLTIMFYLLLWRVVAWYWLALNWWAYITG